MATEGLLPCMFCKGVNVELRQSHLRADQGCDYYIVCLDCGFVTPQMRYSDVLVSLWNAWRLNYKDGGE